MPKGGKPVKARLDDLLDAARDRVKRALKARGKIQSPRGQKLLATLDAALAAEVSCTVVLDDPTGESMVEAFPADLRSGQLLVFRGTEASAAAQGFVASPVTGYRKLPTTGKGGDGDDGDKSRPDDVSATALADQLARQAADRHLFAEQGGDDGGVAKDDILFLEKRLAREKRKNAVLRETYGETRAKASVVSLRFRRAAAKLVQLQELLAIFASKKPAERAKELPPESKLRGLAKALKYQCFYTAQLKRGRSATKRAVGWSEDCLAVARGLCKAQRQNPKARKTARAASLLAGEFATAQLDLMKRREQWLRSQLEAQASNIDLLLTGGERARPGSPAVDPLTKKVAGGGTPYMRGRHLVAKNLQKKADGGGPTSPLSPLTSSKSFRLPSSPSSVVSAGGKSLSPSSTGEKEFEGARKAKRQDRASVD